MVAKEFVTNFYLKAVGGGGEDRNIHRTSWIDAQSTLVIAESRFRINTTKFGYKML